MAALTVAGAVVNVASVWVTYGSSWRWVKEVPSEEASRRHDFIHSLDHGPIAYNLQHLDHDIRPWP